MVIDGNLFVNFCHCRYKASLKAVGEVGEVTEFELVVTNSVEAYKTLAIDRLLKQTSGRQITCRPPSIRQAVEARAGLILDATIEALGVSLGGVVVEALEGKPEGRPTAYVPVVFYPEPKTPREFSLLAALHGIVLSEALACPVPLVKLVHGPDYSISRIKLDGPGGPTRLAAEARRSLDALRAQAESGAIPPIALNAHCPTCEFQGRCRTRAIEKDDLSLMRGISEKEANTLKRRGIGTVAQLARTFRPKSVGAKNRRPPKRHLHALQALAVQDGKVYLVKAPEFPSRETRVYFDVEGMPDRDFYYLAGAVVEKEGRCSTHSFWADDEAGEGAIWSGLLELLLGLGDFTMFHYGSYEKTYLARMVRRYPSQGLPAAGALASDSINVLGAIRTNVYFPTYSNGLKDVASFLGASWGGEIASGIECIARRLRWEESRDESIRREIVAYNLDDCLALRRVVGYLVAIGDRATPGAHRAVPVSEITPSSPWRFGKVDFVLPEMDLINKCARFDYQRDKVHIRTDPGVRASVRRKRVKPKAPLRPDIEVPCPPPPLCPFCGSDRITSFRSHWDSKLVKDLKFTRKGVKRWVVRYQSKRCQCIRCLNTFVPDAYRTRQKIGHGLSSWAVYEHVAHRMSFSDIVSSLADLFGHSVCESTVIRIQTRLAETYRATVDGMLDGLRLGRLIHSDETQVRIKGGTGYVWAFTGTETAVYLYSPTREGAFLKEALGDFSGVLVSDFYTAYDSVGCPQQKCHVHLIRDINEDLIQHPFDEGLKELARRYTVTLKAIVETIDRHGLKTKFLSKHRRHATAFLEWVADIPSGSEVVVGYKARFEKYGDRLFTFLDHDGVPWNNNGAENAIKLVASRRDLLRTSLSETGLKEYLLFLSIYQTLRRKGLSLLKFLLSGCINIDEFVALKRR
jgi:predicted RecB family nuclease